MELTLISSDAFPVISENKSAGGQSNGVVPRVQIPF